MIACRKSFTDTLLSLARMDKDIIAVTTDARGSVTLNDFAKELPQQFVECGIAEQDAVGISAGLAHSGKKVFVCGPACFYVARSLEQVKVDLAYSQNNVKILGVSGGVAYGALGATHHSLHDIAVLRTFPGMNIVLPCDARQTKKLVEFLIDYPELKDKPLSEIPLILRDMIHKGTDLSVKKGVSVPPKKKILKKIKKSIDKCAK